MDAKTAYDKGYDASKRSTTFDLDAAEDRFERRYGDKHMNEFVVGWSDASAGHERYESPAAQLLGYTDSLASMSNEELIAEHRQRRADFCDAAAVSTVDDETEYHRTLAYLPIIQSELIDRGLWKGRDER